MPRPRRELLEGYCYHVTTRCNNREFRLTSTECRHVFLYAIKKALDKYGFKFYALHHVYPAAKSPSRNSTDNRVPLTDGLPNRIFESE